MSGLLKMSYCPKCDNNHYGLFCRTCGTVLIPITSPKCICGGELGKYDEYCRWCGNKVEDDIGANLPEPGVEPIEHK